MNINPNTRDAYKLLHQGILALSRAEQQGFRVDIEYCERMKKELTNRINDLENEFYQTNFYKQWHHSFKGKVNIYSNPQLSAYLYKVKKIKPVKYTDTGLGSADEEALKDLNIPELNLILEMRRWRKARDTYLDAFSREQVNGFIHPFFNLHLARTFRSSSNSPNFQNIPKRDPEVRQIVREALYPREGHQLLEIDYGQLEVRIATAYHKDPTMIKYNTDANADMHGDMANQIFKINYNSEKTGHKLLRAAVKNGFVFPQFYGDYYVNCAENMACKWGKLPHGKWENGQGIELEDTYLSNHFISKGICSLNDFTAYIKQIEEYFWEKRFPVYSKWKKEWWRSYLKNGYVDMLTGFRCSGLMDQKDVINYPIQGSAFHCLLWSFIELDRIMQKENWNTKLIGQIHDSVILDVHPNELDYVVAVAQDITTKKLSKEWDWINVPLEVEIEKYKKNENWGAKTTLI
ncbi:MAG: DNA polymerase [Cyclobacteriaceae bacterium]